MADNANRSQQAKVLRIGIIQDKRVVHERLIKPGQSVSVGSSPKNTFVFNSKNIPKKFTLFQAKNNRYVLNFTESMSGKLSHKDGVVGLQGLREKGEAKKKADGWMMPLTPRNRGKIVVDDVTVLFQFVAAPPESARMAARQDFRPKFFDEDDPVFLGFLAMFSAIATVLMIYVWNTEPVELAGFEDIPDRFVEVIVPREDSKPVENVEVEEDPTGGTEIARDEKPKEAEPADKKSDSEPKSKEEKQAAAVAKEQKKAEVMQKSKLIAGIIGTRGESSSGSTVEDVFADGDGNFSDLKTALQGVGGVEVGSAEAVAMRGQTTGGGREDASIGDLARGGGGEAKVATVKTKAPKANTNLGAVDLASGEDADGIRATLRKYQGQIKYCYEQRLKENPNISGRIAVDVDINGGKVTSVVVSENTTGDSVIEKCVVGKVRRWRFPADFSDAIYLPFALNAG